jgi:hypothetical protein
MGHNGVYVRAVLSFSGFFTFFFAVTIGKSHVHFDPLAVGACNGSADLYYPTTSATKMWGNHMAGPLVGLTMLGTAILRTHFAGRERMFFRGPSQAAPSEGRESRMGGGFTLPSGYGKIGIVNGPLK